MFSSSRSLLEIALLFSFAFDAATAAVLIPASKLSPTDQIHRKRTHDVPSLSLIPISDPSLLTHGRSLRREAPGNGCFDPSKKSNFFWGAYAGNNIYVANFTLSAPGDDELILPVENFAKRLKSIDCGGAGKPMVFEFSDKDSFTYAQSAWKWVDDADINHFTLVTEPDQCYSGDNRSPYHVSSISFDELKLTAYVVAEEKPWQDVAQEFKLHLGHERVNPSTASITNAHLHRRNETETTMAITSKFKQNLFSYKKSSPETYGLDLSIDAEISTGGSIVVDLDIEKKPGLVPDMALNIQPEGVHALMMLSLTLDGTLGKALEWSLQPEIEIPVHALSIAGILEIGPYVTMGVHVGTSAIQGTGEMSIGAKAVVGDDAEIMVNLLHPSNNSIKSWIPHFEHVPPHVSAKVKGNVRAWTELGIQIKAEAFGTWGYQAGVDAQLPYIEAQMSGLFDTNGVCNTQQTLGVDIDAVVGINVNLNAGQINKAPDFKKDIFETAWPLFSTCMPFGDKAAKPTTMVISHSQVEATPSTVIIAEPESTRKSLATLYPIIETSAIGVGSTSTRSPGSLTTNAPIVVTGTTSARNPPSATCTTESQKVVRGRLARYS